MLSSLHIYLHVLDRVWEDRYAQRMPRLPETAHFGLAPDWICEILSPATAMLDRARKLRIYARESVRHAWLVDPATRTVEMLRLEDGRWIVVDTFGATQVARIEPFDAIEFELGLLSSGPARAPPQPAPTPPCPARLGRFLAGRRCKMPIEPRVRVDPPVSRRY